MNCREVEAYLEPYADDELGVSEQAAVASHLIGCVACHERVADHRRYRELVRRQPQEGASPELRARVVRAMRGRALRRTIAPGLAGAAAVAAGAALVVGSAGSLRPWTVPAAPPMVGELVGKHLAYSQIDTPTELASTDGSVVRAWFHERLGLEVVVPDYTPAGIRLLGGRIADAGGLKAAYLFYAKGHTLMSVFIVPGASVPRRSARPVAYRGFEYAAAELSGLHAVYWDDGGTMFGLISMLDVEALLECADRLRAAHDERA